MKEQKKYIFDDPKNVSLTLRLLYVACIVLLALDFVLDRHGEHPLENIPGFYALYGFVVCVLLVVIAKWMRTVLMRSENYYAEQEQNTRSREEHVDS